MDPIGGRDCQPGPPARAKALRWERVGMLRDRGKAGVQEAVGTNGWRGKPGARGGVCGGSGQEMAWLRRWAETSLPTTSAQLPGL